MGDDTFIDKCLAVIDKDPRETFKSDSFTNLDVESIRKILRRDTLDTEEINVWRACCNWAESESIRQYKDVSIKLVKVFHYILWLMSFPMN